MGTFLTASASLMCPHGGTVVCVPGTFQVRISGEPVVLKGDTFTVGGCAFMIGSNPHPCMTVEWIATAQRSTMLDDQPLTTESVGMCKAADKAVQGPVQIVSTQTGVSGL